MTTQLSLHYEESVFQFVIRQKYFDEQKKLIQANYEKYKQIFHNELTQINLSEGKEQQLKPFFFNKLFENCLGYIMFPNHNHNLKTENKNETNSRKADATIFKDGNPIAVIEVKEHSKNINKREVEDQAFGYKNNNRGVKYVITSNFQSLRFYIENTIDFIEYDLFDLTEEQFGELYLCLAYDNLINDLAVNMKKESIAREEKITRDLYNDYKAFYKDLFENVKKYNSEKYDDEILLKKALKLIDRFLFICFAQYKGFLPPNIIQTTISEWKKLKKSKFTKSVAPDLYDCFKINFEHINTGYKDENEFVFAYNGGLFETDEVMESLIISDEILQEHLEKIAGYNFETDIDVNILGHIFENSLPDIDKAKNINQEQKSSSTRKKEGVFYTPNAITNYIIKDTVGELCENKKQELGIDPEDYYYQNKEIKSSLINKLKKYRKWLKEITICDPAVGSGAFLNAALKYLMDEHNYIDKLQGKLDNRNGKYVPTEMGNYILENNLYGVDINESAVEIAKLSLWLRTLRKDQKLSSMKNNIRCGNSLVGEDLFDADKPKYRKAFDWKTEFSNVFEKGGFDIVVGNPPYGVKTFTKADKDFFKLHYKCTKTIKGVQKGDDNSYILFIEKAHKLVKENGLVHLIVPLSVTSSDGVTALHNILFETCSIIKVSNYLHRPQQIFSDAGQAVSIIKFKKDNKPTEKLLTTKPQRKDKDTELEYIIKELNFIDVNDIKLYGRIPKISLEIERSILKKILRCSSNVGKLKVSLDNKIKNKKLSMQEGNISVKNSEVAINIGDVSVTNGNISIENGNIIVEGKEIIIKTKDGDIPEVIEKFEQNSMPIYYRTAGGQYWKVITNHSTGSSKETSILFDKKYTNSIGAILSSSLFFFWHQVISDVLDLKQSEVEGFGIPIKSLTNEIIEKLEFVYNEYMIDIERNLVYHKSSAKQRPQEYQLYKSKHLIDRIDDIICPLYGLTQAETDFIKNYELEFRMRGEK